MKEEQRLSDPGAPRPGMTPLAEFIQVKAAWSGARAPVPDAGVIGEQLSAAMDRALSGLAGEGELTVLAVGGYGQRQLCLHSDVDLILLHDGGATAAAVRPLLYPLWDARLRVGHALHTVREALAMARDDLTALCTLLTGRVVAGPSRRWDDLSEGLARLLRSERAGLTSLLAAEELALWEREPFFVQEADLKEGRGGLRTLDRIRWERQRALLVGEEPALQDEELSSPRGVLLGVRAALHAVQGRAADRFPVELRRAVGEWLDREPLQVAAELYQTMRWVDTLSGLTFGHVRPAGADPVAKVGRQALRFVRDRWARPPATDRRATPLWLARRAAESDGRLGRWEFGLVSDAPPPQWGQADREALIALLASGRAGWEALGSLWEAGWIPKALPELAHLRGLPQAASFHRHPADSHLGRTVDEALDVAGSGGGWWAEWSDEVGALDELLLAAFLHDAGKGLPGDHSQVGASLAVDLLDRVGFTAATSTLVGRLVRHHLLLPEVAFRRDLDDPEVVADVVSAVGDIHTLRLLTLLTVADARATGEESWNEWRSSLLSSLYRKMEAAMSRDRSSLEMEEYRRLLETAGDELGVAAIESHLAAMPSGYLLRFGSLTAELHIRLGQPPPDGDEIRMTALPGAPLSTFIVAARDRPGLLSLVAGILALHNVAILEARVVTREDGVALDTFTVADARGADMVGQARWTLVRHDLEKGAAGRIDVHAALERKRADYGVPAPGPARVEVYRGGRGTTVEVRCGDRIGLLHDLAAALNELDLDVEHAKIDTRAGRVVDAFTVGDPRRFSPQRDEEIKAAVEAAARGAAQRT